MIFVVICWTQVLPKKFSAHIEKKPLLLKNVGNFTSVSFKKTKKGKKGQYRIIDIESADSDISIPLKCPRFPRSRNRYYRNWML
jgi:hypothetical protein